MLRLTMTLTLLLASVPAAGQRIDVAEGDWGIVPLAKIEGERRMSDYAINRIEEIVNDGKCPRAGSWRKVDLSVPFLVHFTPTGGVAGIIVQRIGCPEVETLLGNSALRLAEAGEYAPTGENEAGWYRSEIGFTSTM